MKGLFLLKPTEFWSFLLMAFTASKCYGAWCAAILMHIASSLVQTTHLCTLTHWERGCAYTPFLMCTDRKRCWSQGGCAYTATSTTWSPPANEQTFMWRQKTRPVPPCQTLKTTHMGVICIRHLCRVYTWFFFIDIFSNSHDTFDPCRACICDWNHMFVGILILGLLA